MSGCVCVIAVFIGSAVGQISDDLRVCPPHLNRGGNLVVRGKTCYDVLTYESLSWQDAKEACLRNSGRLVEIYDAATHAFLKEYISTLDNAGSGMWIGLNDQDTEGTWRWDSGTPLTFSHWGSEQPGGVWGFMDDCAVMKTDGYWYDYACDVFFAHFGYICQYSE